MVHKYNIGDLIIYAGLIGRVDYLTETTNEKPMVGLTSIEDLELTTTALESECQSYNPDEEFDQSKTLSEIRYQNALITHSIDRITDKFIGDCSLHIGDNYD